MSIVVDTLSIVVIISMYILGIIGICWCVSFSHLSTLPQIAARRPQASILCGYLCISALVITYPLTMLQGNVSTIPTIPYIKMILTLLSFFTSLSPYYMFTYRTYMVYFDIKFIQALEDNKWRLHIDPNETNWYLKHRNTWGNSNRVFLLLFSNWLFWLIITTISMILNNFQTSKISAMSILLCVLMPTIVDLIVYFKFPKFNDIWAISKEALMIVRFELINIFLYSLLQFVISPQNYTIEYILLPSFAAIFIFGYIYVIIYFPLKIFHLPTIPCIASKYKFSDDFKQQTMLDSDNELSMNSMNSINFKSEVSIQRKGSKTMSLQEILKDKHGFNEFARYLTFCWSLENLLFF
eukprot:157841_1